MDCFAALTTAALVVDLLKIAKLATKQLQALTLSVKDARRLRTLWSAKELLSKLEVDLAELPQAIRPESDVPVNTSANVTVQLRSVALERMEFWSSSLEKPDLVPKDLLTPSIRGTNHKLNTPMDPWTGLRLDSCEKSVDSGYGDDLFGCDAIEQEADQSCSAERAAIDPWVLDIGPWLSGKRASESCEAATQPYTSAQQFLEHESCQAVREGQGLATFIPTFLAASSEVSSHGDEATRYDSCMSEAPQLYKFRKRGRFVNSSCSGLLNSDSLEDEEQFKRCSYDSCRAMFGGDLNTRKGNYKRHEEASHSLSRFECEFCHTSYNRTDNLTHHIRKHHPEHFKPPCKRRRAEDNAQSLICAECRLPFQSLEAHAKAMNHRAFSCTFKNCSSSFCRRDLLLRHELTHTDETNYPCPHCPKYSGKNGFKRKDKLQQHLSNYHNEDLYPRFCDHVECQVKAIAVPQKAFESMKEYRTHLREVHDQTPFPCDWPGCDRKGRKGYSRERDFEAHKRTHQQAITPLYTLSNLGHDEAEKDSATTWPPCDEGLFPSHFNWDASFNGNGSEHQDTGFEMQDFNEDCEQISDDISRWKSPWDSTSV